ncbi:MAG: SA1788 family PVL leukocidin-associated protein [Peptostreptococcaceae bacterium]|nr:SA1788 family PVL leukocidin-associated protein [Peptostreptococcaceae bacterium]
MRKIPRKMVEKAEQNGITYSALWSRLKKGWSMEEATTKKMRKHKRGKAEFWVFEGKALTKEEMAEARKNGLTRQTLHMRIFHGWTIEEAIAAPRGKKRQIAASIMKKSRTFNAKKMSKERADIAEFAKENGLSYGIVVSYLESGLTLKEIRKRYGMKYEKAPHRWAQCFEEAEK